MLTSIKMIQIGQEVVHEVLRQMLTEQFPRALIIDRHFRSVHFQASRQRHGESVFSRDLSHTKSAMNPAQSVCRPLISIVLLCARLEH